MLLPLRFEASRHQPVLGVDRAGSALGTLRGVLRAFERQPPLGERRDVIGLEAFRSAYGCFNAGGLNRMQEGLHGGRVDLQTADVQAVDTAAVLDAFVVTVLARRLVRAAIVRPESPSSRTWAAASAASKRFKAVMTCLIAIEKPETVDTDDDPSGCGGSSTGRCRTQRPLQWVFRGQYLALTCRKTTAKGHIAMP